MNRASSARRRVTKACLAAGAVTAAFGLSGPLAATATAADSCPNAAVRAQQTATGLPSLPDCRAYEIVNPSTDDVGEVNRMPGMSDDGNQLAYESVIPGNDAQGGGVAAISVARRTDGGWSSLSADPVSEGPIWGLTGVSVAKGFSTDFTKGLVETTLPASPADTLGTPDFYRVDVGRGTSTLMSPGLDLFPLLTAGATPSLDRIVFLKTQGTTPAPGLYASDGASREFLSVYPNGTPVAIPSPAGAAYDRGLNIGNGRTAPFVERGGSHGVSDDTRRVYFYDSLASQPNLGTSGLLYLRDHQTTIPVSVSSRTGDVGTLYYAQFISASHDGSVAYFNSVEQLTNSATPGGGLYRFDLASQTVTQITPDAGDPTGLHVGAAIASDDQSHLYFTSTSALAAGAQAGENNAYVWTSTGGVRFIAPVSNPSFARVTPDGRFAILRTTTSINGAPNNGNQAIYRYDDANGQVVCVSCRPDGSPSAGRADIEGQSYGQPAALLARSRALTLDGRVLFTSTDRLLTADQTTAQDVYLYHDGTVSLLTAGRGDSDSFIGDISDDGKNIFVITRTALVGADRDAAEYDLYDVRTGGGFLEPPPPSDPCRGDDCQGPATAAPQTSGPSSSRVTSAGNQPPGKVVKKLSMAKLTAAQRSRLARTGSVSVTVRTTGGGAVSLRGRGRIAGSTKTLGSGREVILKKSVTAAKVSFRLSVAARRELSRRHRLSVTLEARLSGLSRAVTTANTLTRGH